VSEQWTYHHALAEIMKPTCDRCGGAVYSREEAVELVEQYEGDLPAAVEASRAVLRDEDRLCAGCRDEFWEKLSRDD
jgi:hypothetical protein